MVSTSSAVATKVSSLARRDEMTIPLNKDILVVLIFRVLLLEHLISAALHAARAFGAVGADGDRLHCIISNIEALGDSFQESSSRKNCNTID